MSDGQLAGRSARFGALWLVLSLLSVRSLPAIDRTVDILDDENDSPCVEGDCSLREAIAAAGDGDTILFDLDGAPPWTITLLAGAGLGTLSIADDLTIVGPGADDLTISGNNALRLLTIESTATVSISGLRFFDGRATASGDKHGGCVKVLGSATFTSSRFESCEAWDGGLTSNTEGGDGGAVYVASDASFSGDLLVFSANDAGLGGGPSGLPPGFRGGRGGALANAGTTWLTATVVSECNAGNGQGPFAPGGHGGGLANLGGGTLRLDESTLSGNQSGEGGSFMNSNHGPDGSGGALYCEADCAINNSTISGNSTVSTATGAAGQGGGLLVTAGTTRLRNVTVAGNTANGTGGGIARTGGTIRPRNSLFAGNTGASSNHDCSSAAAGVVSEGYNLIRINNGCATSFAGTDQEGTAAAPLEPLLGALAANGGPTETHALGAASPAIDGGDPLGCLAWDGAGDVAMPFDQRGEARETDGDGDAVATCDAGAYEAAAIPPVENDLEVTLAGAPGGGSVTSDPAGIACPGTCTASFVFTETVTLTPSPEPGYAFAEWGGACTGSGACSFDMSVDRTVSATFVELFDLDVTIQGPGSGAVSSLPAGIACPGVCTAAFVDGEVVTLSAMPAPGSFFAGWSGDCTGESCAPTMSADRSVTATFETQRTLTVILAGDGTGSVESLPPGIDCPSACAAPFDDGSTVTLTATPALDALFAGWSGDCSGATCAPVMSAERSVTATFVPVAIFLNGFEAGNYCAWSSVTGAPPCA